MKYFICIALIKIKLVTQTVTLVMMKVTLLVNVLQVKPVIAKLDLSGNSVAEEV